ncbi:phosphogluconate dehydratase [Bradyrhizobium manausense]|uniref:phosphogluconate dehydratase n=1 Tax=Bradyrhizobium TaxID=374 RepID=UPI001BA9F35A|nr:MULTISPECIES: phosphogluconate dehydratase [Bradyrhizobium]MBR0826376.1 phosphogluconate dehydratase [Bradyrhizobium manausense]UVO28784.1 phosphogluconate dehydratase [Bradyrhizobium arachidis]
MTIEARVNARVAEVTDRIARRSGDRRARYLDRIANAASTPVRRRLGCANQAHAFAACGGHDKKLMQDGHVPSLGIVTAYNDMLSAHQPYERFPELIRQSARAAGGVAQVAGGVPAMCDGITQGEAGMELSLFSREVIALSTAIALSHQTFDAAVFLGICDKIVPGLVIGALSFGHLPAVFIPSGPMTSGLANNEKAKIRQAYAEGKLGREALLEAEAQAYHGAGTCTFYGTANTNQMLMEIMGVQLPGASFVNPNTPLRDALTCAATERALDMTSLGNQYTPIGRVLDERAFVNGIVGLHATGGSTNLTLHLVAMAAAAGLTLTWDDFADLAEVSPLLARIYPNGSADVNHFHAAGGMSFLIRELLGAGLLHANVTTVAGDGLAAYLSEPKLGSEGTLTWHEGAQASGDSSVLRGASEPFQKTGGLKVLNGDIGTAIIKTSAVAPQRHVIEAPARVFHSQEELQKAFAAGELTSDLVIVMRFQGPRANGMPELHKLMPPLGVLQDRGLKVALVTDGRLSGASGKVPAAIHVTPEAAEGGTIAKICDGDLIRVDAIAGRLEVLVDPAEWRAREPMRFDSSIVQSGVGRELFAIFRDRVGRADNGASIFQGVAT